ADQDEAVEDQPRHQGDGDRAQRATAATVEDAAQAVADVAQAVAAAAATRRPGVAAALVAGAVVVVLAGDVPGHACSSLDGRTAGRPAGASAPSRRGGRPWARMGRGHGPACSAGGGTAS